MSTKAEMFSVGHPFADTIGLPGGGSVPLWIFGKKYICGVRGFCIFRMFATCWVISFFSTIFSMVSLTVIPNSFVRSFSSFLYVLMSFS